MNLQVIRVVYVSNLSLVGSAAPVEPLQFRLGISPATSVRTFPPGVEHRAPESLGEISMCGGQVTGTCMYMYVSWNLPFILPQVCVVTVSWTLCCNSLRPHRRAAAAYYVQTDGRTDRQTDKDRGSQYVERTHNNTFRGRREKRA